MEPCSTRYRRALQLALAALVLASLAACEPPSLLATRTPYAQMGTTVFAALYWRSPDSAIDVVFVPDSGFGDLGNLTNRQNFYDDVADLIHEGFYQNNAIVSNISLFNFWYMHTPGTVSAPAAARDCPVITWPTLTDAAFAEMVVIVHRNSAVQTDCGWPAQGRASAQAGANNQWLVVHEGMHAAFALPDEYCCDGGYDHVPPILYNSEASCDNDPDNAAWRNCQSFTDIWGPNVWWRSEDMTVDLMSAAGPPVHELGRADWVVVRGVLDGLPGILVNDPSVFAPTTWDWP